MRAVAAIDDVAREHDLGRAALARSRWLLLRAHDGRDETVAAAAGRVGVRVARLDEEALALARLAELERGAVRDTRDGVGGPGLDGE